MFALPKPPVHQYSSTSSAIWTAVPVVGRPGPGLLDCRTTAPAHASLHPPGGMETSTAEAFETLVGTLDLDGNLERSCVLAAAREQLGMPPSTRRLRANLLEVMARRA